MTQGLGVFLHGKLTVFQKFNAVRVKRPIDKSKHAHFPVIKIKAGKFKFSFFLQKGGRVCRPKPDDQKNKTIRPKIR